MHGIHEDFDPSVFVGQTLMTVRFGPYLIDLGFSPGPHLSISLESTYELSWAEEPAWTERVEGIGSEDRVASSRLMRLTGHEVVAAAVESRSCLRLDFAEGHTLRLYEDDDRYESMQIHTPDGTWVF